MVPSNKVLFVKIVLGSAHSIGATVDGQNPRDWIAKIKNGEVTFC